MKNKKFEQIYNLIKDIDSNAVSKIENEIERVSENEYDSKKNEFIQEKINDCIIEREIIEKENFKFHLYLCKFNHVMPPELENYEVKPLEKITYYEYGCIMEYSENNFIYDLNNIFSGIEYDDHFAMDKYQSLKLKIKKLELDKILDEVIIYVEKYYKN